MQTSLTESHSHGADVLRDVAPLGRELRRAIPDVYAGYAQLHGAAFSEGALDVKVKELLALAIAVSKQCDGCIANHARALVRLGATEQEVAEALGVVIVMNGGPGTVYAPRAFAAFREFAAAATPAVGASA